MAVIPPSSQTKLAAHPRRASRSGYGPHSGGEYLRYRARNDDDGFGRPRPGPVSSCGPSMAPWPRSTSWVTHLTRPMAIPFNAEGAAHIKFTESFDAVCAREGILRTAVQASRCQPVRRCVKRSTRRYWTSSKTVPTTSSTPSTSRTQTPVDAQPPLAARWGSEVGLSLSTAWSVSFPRRDHRGPCRWVCCICIWTSVSWLTCCCCLAAARRLKTSKSWCCVMKSPCWAGQLQASDGLGGSRAVLAALIRKLPQTSSARRRRRCWRLCALWTARWLIQPIRHPRSKASRNDRAQVVSPLVLSVCLFELIGIWINAAMQQWLVSHRASSPVTVLGWHDRPHRLAVVALGYPPPHG